MTVVLIAFTAIVLAVALADPVYNAWRGIRGVWRLIRGGRS